MTFSAPKPTVKPANPNFSSGPCSKRPGYDVNALDITTLGRSHRSPIGKKHWLEPAQTLPNYSTCQRATELG